MKEARHQKHAALKKPTRGNFGRTEIALMGTTCSELSRLARQIQSAFGTRLKSAWIDAFHPEDSPEQTIKMEAHTPHASFTIQADLNPHEIRPLLEPYDLVLVNGNHFRAAHQIVALDPVKEDSLSRKLDRLTHVMAFLSTDKREKPYEFIRNALPEAGEIPIIPVGQAAEIGDLVASSDLLHDPKLYGLVLAGGKSVRMGMDKAFLEYFGKPQYARAAALLEEHCEQVFISCRPGQEDDFGPGYACIPDTTEGLGPFGGIVSAFRAYPDVAWLVIACDLPYLEPDAIAQLLEGRNTSMFATAFHNSETGFPDPLITVWEPRAYGRLLYFLSQGYSCPRKVLINSQIETLQPANPGWLMNVNTQEEYASAKKMLK